MNYTEAINQERKRREEVERINKLPQDQKSKWIKQLLEIELETIQEELGSKFNYRIENCKSESVLGKISFTLPSNDKVLYYVDASLNLEAEISYCLRGGFNRSIFYKCPKNLDGIELRIEIKNVANIIVSAINRRKI